MFESLRVRLVFWYALVLILVVTLYGGAVCYQFWRSMLIELDAGLRARAQEVAEALQPLDNERFDLELTTDALEYFRRDQGSYYAVWSRSGDLVATSDPDSQERQPEAFGARTVLGRREVLVPAAAGASVLVGRETSELRRAVWSLTVNMALAAAAMLTVAILGGWFVASRALAPIVRISRVARSMSEGDLAARIPVESTETELEQVASTLNDAFDRLRLAIEHQRRFTADASHELRTPISVLRAEIDSTLGRERSVEHYQQSLAICRRAVLRMQDVVEKLLGLARTEAGDAAIVPAPVALRSLADNVVAWLEPLAQERAITVTVAGEPVDVAGDAGALFEAINNLVTNAILYNRPGGGVTISVDKDGRSARLSVADTGVGIPSAAMPYVFDRFFRVDQARGRDTGGAGLGLSVARAIIDRHGGTISCASQEGSGSVFAVNLPLS